VSLYNKHGEGDIGKRVYEWISEQTTPDDLVLDVNYGGIVNLLCRRRSPIYSTQFVHFAPSDLVMQKDLELFKGRQPKFVIANNRPNLGSVYGPTAYTGCAFPALTWKLSQPAFDAAKSLPVISHIQAHYEPKASFGDIVIYGSRQIASH